MNVDKPLVTPDDEIDTEEMLVELSPDEDDESVEVVVIGHGDNLVDVLSDTELEKVSSDVLDGFNSDVESRSDWADGYVRGLDLLGLKIEDRVMPWAGASGVFHPILLESIIRFQAQAMGEIFPASGPARSKVVSKHTPETLRQAQRVEKEMNYEATEKMVEFREELEQLLFQLPMAGSAFKKVFYDPIEKRPCSMFVPSEDLVVSYGATNLEKAERYTHVMKKTSSEVEELMDVGFYADIDIGEASPEESDIQQKYSDLSGETQSYGKDTRHTILEQHCMLKLDADDGELAKPYVVTVDKTSSKVLSIRRNWLESDDTCRKRMHFVHYKYLPGLGFYGIGLIHILGGLSKTATSILRQLIDAGTLSNLPAGFKTRGFRVKGDNTPFRPGEFRDVDVPGSSIRDHITFLPFKEPSSVLYNLLGSVVDEARRMGAVAETELTSVSKEMPVGTAFAILERQMKVMSGVQARLHAAQHKELKLIANIIHTRMDEKYDWDHEGEFNRKEDFDGRVDVVPVSDPNAATTAQKVVSYQAAMQMAEKAPNLYDMGKLHRQMLDVLQIDNAEEILKLPEDIKAMDPVTENMAILKQEPVKAYMYQDHEAHIRTHMAAAQDPKILQIVGQSPFASAIQSAMSAHITEHVAMAYRKKIEENLGVPLPGMDEPMPEDVEVEVSRLTAAAGEKLLRGNQAEMAQQKAQAEAQDPLTIIQRKEIEMKEREQKHKEEMDKLKVQLEAFKHGTNMAHMKDRLDSEEMRAAGNLAAKIATDINSEDKVTLEALKIVMAQAMALQQEGKKEEPDGN